MFCSIFICLLIFLTFYQEFEEEKKKACDKIEWLEGEVWKLELQLRESKQFDIGLITGSGRGHPKVDAFVRHVRCLLATGFYLPCSLSLCMSPPLTGLSPVSCLRRLHCQGGTGANVGSSLVLHEAGNV